jgi:hypothetical protein
MAPILTPEDVVRRIAAECAYVDERGGVGIRLEPAAYCSHRTAFMGSALWSVPHPQRSFRPRKPQILPGNLTSNAAKSFSAMDLKPFG